MFDIAIIEMKLDFVFAEGILGLPCSDCPGSGATEPGSKTMQSSPDALSA